MARKFKLQCKLCGGIFEATASNVMYCQDCYEDRKCSNEGCENVIKHVVKNDVGNHFCGRKCRYEHITKMKTAPGVCSKCGEWSEVRDSTARCPQCVSKQTTGMSMKNRYYVNKCQKCGNEFTSKASNTMFCANCYVHFNCLNCGKEVIKPPGEYEKVFCCLFCQQLWRAKQNVKPGNCILYGKWSEKRDSVGRCSLCVSKQVQIIWENMTDEEISKRTEYLIHEGITVKYCEKCDELTPHNGKRCLSCNPMNERFGGSILHEINGILQYFDIKSKKWIEWEDYKKSFLERMDLKDLPLPDGFVIINTFREQKSETWKNSATVFEQQLIDMNIGWFVYIKFYIDKNVENKPLVIGKSGSKLVNKSGSDVNFSENPDDGPARKLLLEQGLQWNKTMIAVLSYNEEKESYEKELNIGKQMDYFSVRG